MLQHTTECAHPKQFKSEWSPKVKLSIFIVWLLPQNTFLFEENLCIKLLLRANIDKLLGRQIQPCHRYDQLFWQ